MAELAGVMVGNYFLLECLGREGMVETYRARPTTKGGYDVVLRLFRPPFPDPTAFHDHFATEVEKVWRSHHEHIQPLLEFGTGAGLLYCATKWTETETLEQYLHRQQGQPIPVPFAVCVVTQLCAALEYAHEQGIVHGNIQPSSILVQDEEHVVLTNFAMKRAYQEHEPAVAQIEEGNPFYVAPEQAVGMLSPASDIYALGVLLYRLLAGRLPYGGENAGEIVMQHANEPIPSLRSLRPEVPESLELVVRVALAKSPAARFATAADFAKALVSGVLPGSPTGSQVVTATAQPRIAVRSRRTKFTWTRALSLLTLTSLLFGFAGTLFFVSSLPQGINELAGFPFYRGGRPGSEAGSTVTATVVTAPPSREAPTPTVGKMTATAISVAGSGVPGTKTPVPALTPIASGTVPINPIGRPSPVPAPTTINCVPGALALDGSPNLKPLLQQVDSDYQALCPGVTLVLNADGSRAALNYVQQGQIDIAVSDLTAAPARNLSDHPTAALLYAVIVSPDVQISDLSSTALQGIYSGQITNWARMGGPDEPIRVILHPPSSTITAIFRSFVLGGMAEHVKGIKLKKEVPATFVQAVAQTPGAISYVPLMLAQSAGVQVVAIDGVSPNMQSLIQGSYPFWSIEHFYTQGNGSAQAQAYIQFFASAQEASAIVQYSAVPFALLPQAVLTSHLPGPKI
jgi:eukaryotic-like serine/threonine-protein kinase